jgi:alkane 1-monooxygenase
MHLLLVFAGLSFAGAYEAKFADAAAAGIVVGLIGTAPVIAVAHELLHQQHGVRWQIGWFLSVTAGVPHFPFAHVAVHHASAATVLDPDTARRNEGFYDFYARSLAANYLATIKSGSQVGLMLSCVTLAALHLGVGACAGLGAMAFVAVQAVIGLSVLMSENYMHHYGLERYAGPATPFNSWNSNDWLSNSLLFDLLIHSDHHCDFSKIKAAGGTMVPSLPGNILGMFWVALIPPLWRWLMADQLRAAARSQDQA